MKQLLQQYASYHIWANERLLECINGLSDEQIHREVVSSFPGIYKTVLHMWSAERAWWLRLQQHPNVDSIQDWFTGDFNELKENILLQSKQWQEWATTVTEEALLQLFSYKTFKGDPFTQPLYEVVFHVFNHSTYHRGQLVTILRQLGVEKIPSTDLIVFYRYNK